jgi:hypothetical protein
VAARIAIDNVHTATVARTDATRAITYGDRRDVGGLHSALPGKTSYFRRRQVAESLVQPMIEQDPNVIFPGTANIAVGAFSPILELWRSDLLAHAD